MKTNRESPYKAREKEPPQEGHEEAQSEYRQNYRKANFFSKIVYYYVQILIGSIRKNKGMMKEEFLESINKSDKDTENQISTYYHYIQEGVDKAEKQGKTPDFYYILRNAIFKTYIWDIVFCTFYIAVAEIVSVFYSYFIGNLIRFIRNPDAPVTEGVYLTVVFIVAILISSVMRNVFYFHSYRTFLLMRRTLITGMYDKVSKLSMKSLTETNSGKLITLISSDIFSIEKGLANSPILFAAPLINVVCYIFIGTSAGWWYSLSTFILWVLVYTG